MPRVAMNNRGVSNHLRMATVESVPLTKICTKCGNEYPATSEFFARSKDCKYGFAARCKTCAYAIKKAWYQENKQDVKEYDKARRPPKIKKGRDPEAAKRAKKKYNEKNKEILNQKARDKYHANIEKEHERAKKKNANPIVKIRKSKYNKRYRVENPEKVRNGQREWRKNNPLKTRTKQSERRARERNAEGRYTTQDVKNKYTEQNGKCYWCGKKVGKKYHVDHINPLSRGGSNWPDNICISCPYCNDSRGAKLPQEWGRLL